MTSARVSAIVVAVARRSPRALLVEEDPLIRLAIDRQLDALGWDTLSVDSGEEAIRVVELGFIIDVMLTGLTLPDGDGRVVARAVTRMSPRIRVAFIAAAPPVEPLDMADAPLLLNPFSTSALQAALVDAVAYPR